MGSFAGAVVWRLHNKRDFVRERSECESCHHELAWYDLVPILSWLALKGRCRYCKAPLSLQHPLVESLTAGLFVLSYAVWPYGDTTVGWVLLGIWLLCLVALVALAIYDLRWMLLPDVIVFPLIVLGIVFGLLQAIGIENRSVFGALVQVILGILSIGGFYGLLYVISRGAWVGFGDVKLGIFMGALLGWQAGLVALILANAIGFLVVVPGLVSGKLTRRSRVPFGPFLIAGFLLAGLFAQPIIGWYAGMTGDSLTLIFSALFPAQLIGLVL